MHLLKSLKNSGLFLWGAEEVVPSQRKEWRGRGDRKDLQNSHCWSKPDFQHKTKGQWKLWELSFFFLAFSLFPSPLFFLYFLPSPLSLQSDKVFVLHFKQKRAQNLGGQSKKKKKNSNFKVLQKWPFTILKEPSSSLMKYNQEKWLGESRVFFLHKIGIGRGVCARGNIRNYAFGYAF